MNQPANDYRKEVTQDAIKRCVDATDRKHPGWSDEAHELIIEYARRKRKYFLCEDFRDYCNGKIKEPQHLRAYGGIMIWAANRGIIRKVGFDKVKTPSSHMANAGVWVANR